MSKTKRFDLFKFKKTENTNMLKSTNYIETAKKQIKKQQNVLRGIKKPLSLQRFFKKQVHYIKLLPN